MLVKAVLATCVNYADLNNSILRMRGNVSAGFFRRDCKKKDVTAKKKPAET